MDSVYASSPPCVHVVSILRKHRDSGHVTHHDFELVVAGPAQVTKQLFNAHGRNMQKGETIAH